MEEVRTEMTSAITEVIHLLRSQTQNQDLELCVTRLEVLTENALTYEDISLEVVDLLNQALNVVKRTIGIERGYDPYAASLVHDERRPGRPKFEINEDQLLFFKGKIM
jgi:hypothetical protein